MPGIEFGPNQKAYRYSASGTLIIGFLSAMLEAENVLAIGSRQEIGALTAAIDEGMPNQSIALSDLPLLAKEANPRNYRIFPFVRGCRRSFVHLVNFFGFLSNPSAGPYGDYVLFQNERLLFLVKKDLDSFRPSIWAELGN